RSWGRLPRACTAPLPTVRAGWCGRGSRPSSSAASWTANHCPSKARWRAPWIPVASDAAQYRGARVLDLAHAGERHGDVELLADGLQRREGARLAHGAEPVDE